MSSNKSDKKRESTTQRVYRALSTANIRPNNQENSGKKHKFKFNQNHTTSRSDLFAKKSGSVNINLPIKTDKKNDDNQIEELNKDIDDEPIHLKSQKSPESNHTFRQKTDSKLE